MSNGSKHTVSAFDEDIDKIRGLISEMGARAETMLADALKALADDDLELASVTAKSDKAIDALEIEVERLVVQTIALRAPMADDLRELIADLKMSAVIERIGDYSKNIAKRVKKLETRAFLDNAEHLRRMGRIASEMVRSVMEAYAKRDVDLARAVHNRDSEVDQIFKELFVDLIGYIAKNPESAHEVAHLLVISKNIERIGDHASTCAEMIFYTETGDRLQGDQEG